MTQPERGGVAQPRHGFQLEKAYQIRRVQLKPLAEMQLS